jgi:hypothetical protein
VRRPRRALLVQAFSIDTSARDDDLGLHVGDPAMRLPDEYDT